MSDIPTSDRLSAGEYTALLEDSDGHRLAEFLLKKNGGTTRPKRIFSNYNAKRFSIDIRTEVVQQETNCEDQNDKQLSPANQEDAKQLAGYSNENGPKGNKSHNDQQKHNEMQREPSCGLVSSQLSKDKVLEQGHAFAEQPEDNIDADLEVVPLQTPTDIDKPQEQPGTMHLEQSAHIEAAQAARSLSPSAKALRATRSLPHSAKAPQPPRVPGRVIPSSDRLRRCSLKCLISGGGRRTLLTEFESTITTSNFIPPICSTPLTPSLSMARKQPDKTADRTSSSIKTGEKDLEDMLCSIRKHEEELKNLLENCNNMTSHKEKENTLLPALMKDSPAATNPQPNLGSRPATPADTNRRRTYTIQKGLSQAIRTPNTLRDQPSPAAANSYAPPTSPVEEAVYSLHVESAAGSLAPAEHLPLPDILVASPKPINQRISQRSTNQPKPSRIPRYTPNKFEVDVVNTPAKVSSARNLNEIAEFQVIPHEEDEIEIPETQQSQTQLNKCPEVLHGEQRTQGIIPAVLIPINQTFDCPADISKRTNLNKGCLKENENQRMSSSQSQEAIANVLRSASAKTKEKSTQNTEAPPPSRSPSKSPQISDVDNLHFCDILSDDEKEEENVSSRGSTISDRTRMQRSNAPLNLAASPTDSTHRRASAARTRRLRKRLSVRRSSIPPPTGKLSPLLSTETEAETGPPRAHIMVPQRTSKRRKIPLNAAPRTPINGEPFAIEMKNHLARLNNRQILDLRKRNSLGKVFPISGCRTSRSSTQQALDQQQKLEEELRFEILKRNLDDAINEVCKDSTSGDERSAMDECLYEIPPAPPGFRDEHISRKVSETSHQQQGDVRPEALLDGNAVVHSSKRGHNSSLNNASVSGRTRQRRKTPLNVSCREGVVDESAFEVPPAPPGFRDDIVSQTVSETSPARHRQDVPPEMMAPDSSLIDDRISEQVTFSSKQNATGNQSRKGRSTRSKKSVPEVLQKYMDIQNQLGQPKASKTSTKRSLYSKDADTSNESMRNSSGGDDARSPNKNCTARNVENAPVPAQSDPENVPASVANSTMAGSSLAEKSNSSIFKKPQLPAPKAKPKRKTSIRKKIANDSVDISATGSNDSDQTSTLRRSKRGPKPFKNYWSFRSTDPTPLYDFTLLDKRREEDRQRRLARTNSLASTTASDYCEQTTNLASSASATSNNRNLREKENSRKRSRPRNKFGDTDSSSLSSGTSAPNTSRERLPVIAELESNSGNTSAAEVDPEPGQCLGNNMFNRLEEVDISFATTHKVSRTPRRYDQSAREKEQLHHPTNAQESPTRPEKTKDKTSKRLEAEIVKAKSSRTQTKKKKEAGAASKAPSRSSRKKALVEMEQVVTTAVEAPASAEPSNNMVVSSSTVAHINSMIDQLANASDDSSSVENKKSTKKGPKPTAKKLRVRLPRLKSDQISHVQASLEKATTASCESSFFSSSSGTNRNQMSSNTSKNNNKNTVSTINTDADTGAPSWLKDISHVGSKILKEKEKQKQIFKEMHCSIPRNLVLAHIDGLDYAYYDNDQGVPFGYLRFKPKQVKREKKARLFQLKFFVLSGSFRIKTNKEQDIFSEGAVITIHLGSRYSIENLTDKVAILMVFKEK